MSADPDDYYHKQARDKKECEHIWKIKEDKRYGSYYHQCQLCNKISYE